MQKLTYNQCGGLEPFFYSRSQMCVCCSSAGVKESSAGLFLYLLMTIRFLMDLSWVWYKIEWTLLFLLGIYIR